MGSTIIETIQKRYSVRYYSENAIEKEKRQKIVKYFSTITKGPLGSKLRFQLIDATNYKPHELKEFGTYGLITGAKVYISGAVKKGIFAMEDFGYCLENILLLATELGLGTCWLGGTLNRSTFAKKMKVIDNELMPAVSPLGYTGEKKTLKENVIRMFVGAKNRKSFSELFFKGNPETPLNPAECEEYEKVLESVRLAPSAANKQPWRIIKDDHENIFHFYLKENVKLNSEMNGIQIQNVDMGIAMCHFERAAQELALKGVWQKNKPVLAKRDLIYIISWMG